MLREKIQARLEKDGKELNFKRQKLTIVDAFLLGVFDTVLLMTPVVGLITIYNFIARSAARQVGNEPEKPAPHQSLPNFMKTAGAKYKNPLAPP